MGILLALVLAAPVVGVQTDGAAPCDTNGFVRALRALRPELEIVPVHPGTALPGGAWFARIEGLPSDQAALQVSGNPTPLLRPLPGDDCARAVETAASIVDGLLDQLPNPARDVVLAGNSAGSRASLSAWLGAGTLQGPIRWVAAFGAGARFGLGSLEFVGSADVGLRASAPLTTLDQGRVGSYQAVPVDLELGAGWGPHLGPGRLSLDGLAGGFLTTVSAKAPPTAVFGEQPQVAAEFFLAAAAGYVFDLPGHFLFGIRVEERWAPAHTNVTVPPSSGVLTRTWTFTSTGVIGWRFF